MHYSEYGDYLGDAQVAYDGVFDGPDLDRSCLLKVAVPLELAINIHLDVLGLLGDCIDEYACDFSDGKTNDTAQREWIGADNVLDRAKTGLARLAP
ncbi:hypothetical protein [Nocardioides sp. 1609]|uniref:hypothetical protein n=1 Tax=Nocardioides sp. 1609 TaxID=2508327 RepID=UPI00106FCB95|nr:hypothetical protein [Nocardioides sp. 1609]